MCEYNFGRSPMEFKDFIGMLHFAINTAVFENIQTKQVQVSLTCSTMVVVVKDYSWCI